MKRQSSKSLPKYLELHPINQCCYYKNPSMSQKANLGTTKADALRVAISLNTQFERDRMRRTALAQASQRIVGVRFDAAFTDFVEKTSGITG